MKTIYYDRILPYRHLDSVRADFAKIYCEAFNDPNEAYEEHNTIQSTINDVWNPHISHGRVYMAIDGDTHQSVGLACVEPIEVASSSERDYAETVFAHLAKEHNIHCPGFPIWYFSELAVLKDYRNREEHIGSRLIDVAYGDLRVCTQDGIPNNNQKIFVLVRTDAHKSLSRNSFARAGFSFLDDIIQCDENSLQIIKHGGKSVDKVWGYDIIRPISYY